jgi:hypothetical protein
MMVIIQLPYFTDAKGAATNPNNLKKEIHTASKKNKINLQLAGGWRDGNEPGKAINYCSCQNEI